MKTIVIVDYDEQLNKYESMLNTKRDEFNFILLNNSEAACELAENGNVDILVCELNMPLMSGTELFDMFSILSPDTIKIAMSDSNDFHDILNDVNRSNAFKLVLKPVVVASDLIDPIRESISYAEMKMKQADIRYQSTKQSLENDEQNRKLSEEISRREREYENMVQAALHILKGNLSLNDLGLNESHTNQIVSFYSECLDIFLKYHFIQSITYQSVLEKLVRLFHNPAQMRQYYLYNKIEEAGEELSSMQIKRVAFCSEVFGYLCNFLFKKYRVLIMISKEKELANLKFKCEFNEKDFISQEMESNQKLIMQIQFAIDTIMECFFEQATIKTTKNPYTANIFIE